MRVMLLTSLLTAASPAFANDAALRWDRLPDLPDREGFGGMFAGISGGALVVAGGSNFVPGDDGKPVKQWSDAIWVLAEPDGEWRRAETTLPLPLAYGVSVTHGDGVVCAGGNNTQGLQADAFRLTWTGQDVRVDPLPALPEPNAYAAGALVGDTLYVAGGVPRPGETEARATFLALDLGAPTDGADWRELPTWPGPGRQTAVAAAQAGQFILISGVALERNDQGKAAVIVPYLRDVYAYTPGDGGATGSWRRLADAPHPLAAAPSPAFAPGDRHVIVCGGIDGSSNGIPLDRYPPFPRAVSIYDVQSDTWRVAGEMPEGSSRVTAPTSEWAGRYVIVNGESKPGRRSPEVYTASYAP